MSVVSFIVLALALGISAMLLTRRCTEASPVPLSLGLLISFTIAVVHTALFCLGMLLGNLLRFELPDNPDAFARPNAFIFLGIALTVSVRLLWPYMGRKTQPQTYDFNAGVLRVLLFNVASGINGFLLGLGAGFVASIAECRHAASWPMLISLFLLSYLGVMYGRQHVKLRPRRWLVVSGVILILTALATVINAG